MKLVAVSQRIDLHPDRNERRDAIDQRLITLLQSTGWSPLVVPNGLGPVIHEWLAATQPTACVLSGGNDIGEHPDRDITEHAMLDYAEQHRFPALGICRGMQMMAHRAGGTLHRVNGHVATRHQLCGGIEAEVNSYHAFSLAACPPGFRVLAKSPDGESEAIEHLSLPWQGWMWHPERENPFSERDLQNLKNILHG